MCHSLISLPLQSGHWPASHSLFVRAPPLYFSSFILRAIVLPVPVTLTQDCLWKTSEGQRSGCTSVKGCDVALTQRCVAGAAACTAVSQPDRGGRFQNRNFVIWWWTCDVMWILSSIQADQLTHNPAFKGSALTEFLSLWSQSTLLGRPWRK